MQGQQSSEAGDDFTVQWFRRHGEITLDVSSITQGDRISGLLRALDPHSTYTYQKNLVINGVVISTDNEKVAALFPDDADKGGFKFSELFEALKPSLPILITTTGVSDNSKIRVQQFGMPGEDIDVAHLFSKHGVEANPEDPMNPRYQGILDPRYIYTYDKVDIPEPVMNWLKGKESRYQFVDTNFAELEAALNQHLAQDKGGVESKAHTTNAIGM